MKKTKEEVETGGVSTVKNNRYPSLWWILFAVLAAALIGALIAM